VSGVLTSDDGPFRELVGGFAPPIAALAQAVRRFLFDAYPKTVEVVWLRQRNAGYGTGPAKRTEQFAWLSPHTGHVSLGFYDGAELPDPDHRLEGTGALMRHVKLRSTDDIDASLRALLDAAVRHRVPPFPD
jgi:hypothetical protein